MHEACWKLSGRHYHEFCHIICMAEMSGMATLILCFKIYYKEMLDL